MSPAEFLPFLCATIPSVGRVSPAMADAANVADGAGVSAPTLAEEKPPQKEEKKNSTPPAVTPHDTAETTRNEQLEWLGVAREGGEYVQVDHGGKLSRWKGPNNVLKGKEKVSHVYFHICVQCSSDKVVYVSPGDILIFSSASGGPHTIYIATITRRGVPCQLLCTDTARTTFALVPVGEVVAKSRAKGIDNEQEVAALVEKWLLENDSATLEGEGGGVVLQFVFCSCFFLHDRKTFVEEENDGVDDGVDSKTPKSLVSDDPVFEDQWKPSAGKRRARAASRDITASTQRAHHSRPRKHPVKRETHSRSPSPVSVKRERAAESLSGVAAAPVAPSTVARSEGEAASIAGYSIVIQPGAHLHIGTLIQNHYHGTDEENKKT